MKKVEKRIMATVLSAVVLLSLAGYAVYWKSLKPIGEYQFEKSITVGDETFTFVENPAVKSKISIKDETVKHFQNGFLAIKAIRFCCDENIILEESVFGTDYYVKNGFQIDDSH